MKSRIDLAGLVAKQLGRKPSIPFTIAVECHYGWPAVLSNEAITPAGKPNPNLFYLSCPFLRRELARLEDCGYMRTLEETLKLDDDLASDLKESQSRHRQEWIRSARAVAPGQLAGQGAAPGRHEIQAPNIAATRNDLLLKCLHAHLAWFLVHPDYRLGKIIAEQLGGLWCRDETCRRYLQKWPE